MKFAVQDSLYDEFGNYQGGLFVFEAGHAITGQAEEEFNVPSQLTNTGTQPTEPSKAGAGTFRVYGPTPRTQPELVFSTRCPSENLASLFPLGLAWWFGC